MADLWKFTPLHEAAAKGKYEICKLLLKVRRLWRWRRKKRRMMMMIIIMRLMILTSIIVLGSAWRRPDQEEP